MKELTQQELKDKIMQAQQDLARLEADGHPKQSGILTQYLEYLQDQLKDLEKNGNS